MVMPLTIILLLNLQLVAAVEMVQIPSGTYRPLYLEPKSKLSTSKMKERLRKGDEVRIESFFIDTHAVTRADFKKFVTLEPRWARSKAKRIFAEATYLKDWVGDNDPGSSQYSDSPVRYVSWFAARAYCRSQGKRLPTLNEWEYVASKFSSTKNLNQSILDWYSKPNPTRFSKVRSGPVNDFGVYDLHGTIWEWVEDFNSGLVTGESREDSSPDEASFCGAGGLNASDFENYAAFMRFGFRSSLRGAFSLANLGFRCAKDVQMGGQK